MMALSSILRIYRARLRSKSIVIQELLAVLGLAVGVALLFASQVTSASLNRSVAQLSKQLVGNMQLQLLARGPNGFPDTLLPRVRNIPGVEQALPVLKQQADVIGPHGRASVDLIGTGPQFAHAGGPLLHRFSAKQLNEQKALALPVPVAQRIGAESLTPIEVQVASHVTETLLGATLHEGDIGSLVDSPVAVAPVAYAQQLTDMRGRITRIFLKIRKGRVRAVRHSLERLSSGRVNVEPASFDSKLFAQAAGPANQGAALFSAISALVGFMFAFNALLITAQMRRDLIGELRRHGATRAMTVQALLFDALMLGALGGILGLLLGALLSVLVFHPNPGYLSYAFPVGSERVITWQSVALSLGAGFLAAAIGVLAPLRGSLSRPLRAGAANRPQLTLARRARIAQALGGIVCLAVTSAILAFSPAAAILGTITLLLALLCLLPPLFDALMRAFESLQRPLLSAATRLAVIELRTPATRTRSLAIAATGAVAVFGSVAIDGAHRNLQSGLDRVATDMSSGSALWISAAGSANTLTTTPFAATTRTPAGRDGRQAISIESKLLSLPDTSSVSIYRGSFLDIGDRRTWVIAPSIGSPAAGSPAAGSPAAGSPAAGVTSARAPSTASLLLGSQLLSGDPQAALSRLRAGGWAVVSKAIATEAHLKIGDRFTLPSPHPIVLRVAALSTNVGWPGRRPRHQRTRILEGVGQRAGQRLQREPEARRLTRRGRGAGARRARLAIRPHRQDREAAGSAVAGVKQGRPVSAVGDRVARARRRGARDRGRDGGDDLAAPGPARLPQAPGLQAIGAVEGARVRERGAAERRLPHRRGVRHLWRGPAQ